MADTEKENIWWLASANKYRDRPGQGCFSPPAVASKHSFGWDRTAESFVIRDNLGIAGYVHHLLPVPMEIAEAFLLECLRSDFRRHFLTSILPRGDALKLIRVSDKALKVHRGNAALSESGTSYVTLPGLSLEMLGIKDSHLFLFDGLRRSFGYFISGYSADSVRLELQGA